MERRCVELLRRAGVGKGEDLAAARLQPYAAMFNEINVSCIYQEPSYQKVVTRQ